MALSQLSEEVVDIVTSLIATLENSSMFASRLAALGGTDFADIRQRAAGDPCRDIDWPRTMASGKMHLRLREQERSIPVCIAYDVSNSMLMSGYRSKRDIALEVMDVVVQGALRKSCAVMIVLFSDGIECVRRSIFNIKTYEHVRMEILAYQSRAHTMTDIKGIMQYLAWELRSPTLICMISDFLSVFDWEEDFESLLRFHELLPVVIEDPRDYRGPAGLSYCQGIESGNVRLAFANIRDEVSLMYAFFQRLLDEGYTVWTRLKTTELSSEHIKRLVDMFRMCEEQMVLKTIQRR